MDMVPNSKKRLVRGIALIILLVSFMVFYTFCRDDLVGVAAKAMSGEVLSHERPYVNWDSRGYRCRDFHFFYVHENERDGKLAPGKVFNTKSRDDGSCKATIRRMYSDWDIHIYTPTWDNVVVVRPVYGEQ